MTKQLSHATTKRPDDPVTQDLTMVAAHARVANDTSDSDQHNAPASPGNSHSSSSAWLGYVAKPDAPLRAAFFQEMLEGTCAGLAIPNVVGKDTLRRAVRAFNRFERRKQKSKRYGGKAANLGAGIGEPHWTPRYQLGNSPEAWKRYFDAVPVWERQRRQVLVPSLGCDPLDMLVGIVEAAWQKRLQRAKHPRFGRLMGAGLVQTGAAKPHFDNAAFDVPMEIVGHIGVVLVLDGRLDATQRVYRMRPTDPNEETGNYDIPVPAGTPYVDLPSPPGTVNLLPATYVHAVNDGPQRLTVALHLVVTRSGIVCYYS
jgi:hypothetical protein